MIEPSSGLTCPAVLMPMASKGRCCLARLQIVFRICGPPLKASVGHSLVSSRCPFWQIPYLIAVPPISMLRLQLENVRLTDLNGCQAALMQEFIDQLAELSVRERIFSIADALIGGQPVAVSSGGGGNSDSDLRWDGRRPDEEEEAYRRRCLLHAAQVVRNSHKSTIHR